MEGLGRMKSAPLDTAAVNAREQCFMLEQMARLGGNGAMVMELDRLPSLVLGPVGQVTDEAEKAAIALAFPQLAALLRSLSNPHPSGG